MRLMKYDLRLYPSIVLENGDSWNIETCYDYSEGYDDPTVTYAIPKLDIWGCEDTEDVIYYLTDVLGYTNSMQVKLPEVDKEIERVEKLKKKLSIS